MRGLMQALALLVVAVVPVLAVLGLSTQGVQTARLNTEYLLDQVARSHLYTDDVALPQWAGPLAVSSGLSYPPGSLPGALPDWSRPKESQAITIVVDPGHGARDPGAVHHAKSGRVDLTERDSSLDIAVRLKRYLERAGYRVLLTHTAGPESLGPPLDLGARIHFAHAVGADLFLSLHHNGSINPRQSGVEVWFCAGHPFGPENRRLAQLVLDHVLESLHQQGYRAVNRGLKEDAYYHGTPDCQFYATRWPQMPTVLAELLFVTNDADAEALKRVENREAMARGLARAVTSFLEQR